MLSASRIQQTNGIGLASITVDGFFYYFGAGDNGHPGLWKTDGTAAGTTLVADLNPGAANTPPDSFYNVNGTLYFSSGGIIYKSDGTAAGTSVIFQDQPAYGPPLDTDFTAAGNQVYFFGNDTPGHWALFRTDGTAAGTVQVQTLAGGGVDYSPGSGIGTPIAPQAGMANLDGTLYFIDTALWKVDADGHTEQIDTSASPTYPLDLVAFNHRLYYNAEDAANPARRDVFESDGTPAGTTVFWPDADAYALYPVGNYLYIVTYPQGQEQLYRTDGTATGTVLLANISVDSAFAAIGDQAYFVAHDLDDGSTIWATDGTPAGTRPVDPPVLANADDGLVSANGLLYFVGLHRGQLKYNLYETDGTTMGLVDPTEVTDGFSVTDVRGLTANGLIFQGADAHGGGGLWSVPTQGTWPPLAFPPPPAPPPSTLVPTLGRVALKPQVVAGSKLNARVPVIVTNNGNAFDGDITVNLYAETGTSIDGTTQTLLATKTRYAALKPKQRASFTFGIGALPDYLSSGTYHLVAQVTDPAGNANTAASSRTVQVAARSGHTSVTVGPSVPGVLPAGRSGSIVITVANQMNIPASPGHITITLIATDTLRGSSKLLTIAAASLPAGKTHRFRLTFTLPRPGYITPATYSPEVEVTLGGQDITADGDSLLKVT